MGLALSKWRIGGVCKIHPWTHVTRLVVSEQGTSQKRWNLIKRVMQESQSLWTPPSAGIVYLVLFSSSSNIIPLRPDRLPSSHPEKRCSSQPISFFNSSSLLQRHIYFNSGSSVPSIAAAILSPITGKNLNPWPEPPVAMKRDL